MNSVERDLAIIRYGWCAKFEEHADWLLRESFGNQHFQLTAEERQVIQRILNRAVSEKGDIRRRIMDETMDEEE